MGPRVGVVAHIFRGAIARLRLWVEILIARRVVCRTVRVFFGVVPPELDAVGPWGSPVSRQTKKSFIGVGNWLRCPMVEKKSLTYEYKMS